MFLKLVILICKRGIGMFCSLARGGNYHENRDCHRAKLQNNKHSMTMLWLWLWVWWWCLLLLMVIAKRRGRIRRRRRWWWWWWWSSLLLDDLDGTLECIDMACAYECFEQILMHLDLLGQTHQAHVSRSQWKQYVKLFFSCQKYNPHMSLWRAPIIQCKHFWLNCVLFKICF